MRDNHQKKLDRIKYIQSKRNIRSEPNFENLSLVDKQRLGFAEMLDRIESEGKTLYHLTLTYIPSKYKDWTVDQINGFFKEFYIKYFLRYALNTSHITNKRQKERQPIVFCFVDESSFNKSSVAQSDVVTRLSSSLSGDRLHHHAIVCAHPDTVQKIDELLGDNTFKDSGFGKRIQSSSMRRCNSNCILYASKNLHRIPDFQIFPQIPLDQFSAKKDEDKYPEQFNLLDIHMDKNSMNLDKDLHLRVSKTFDSQLSELARLNHLPKSTFTRAVLMRHAKDYLPFASSQI